MPLDNTDRERVRYHLGYPNQTSASSLSFGQPIPRETVFLLETAMTNIPENAIPRILNMLKVLDNIECKLIEAQDRLSAKKMGNLELRDDEPNLLEAEYYRWGGRLADQLGAPFYAYSNRYKQQGGVMVGSIPTRH